MLLGNKTFRGLLNLYSGTVLSGFGWAMVLPITPTLASAFGVSPGAVAQVVTAFFVGRTTGIPVAGIFADRFGTRPALIGGPGLVVVSALTAAATPWFALILVAVYFAGLGDALWALSREIAGIDLVRRDQRGRVLSGFHGLNSAGTALGPLLGGLLADTLNHHVVFLGYAIVASGGIVLGITAHHARATAHKAEQNKPQGPSGIGHKIRALASLLKQVEQPLRLTYAALVLATIAAFIFRGAVQSMLPLYGSRLGFSDLRIGTLFTISSVVVLAMIIPSGFILDKLGRKWATVPSTMLPGIAFLLIPFTNSFLQLAGVMVIVGMCNGLSLGSLAASTYDVVPDHARGRLQAFRRTFAEVGGVGAPFFGGLLVNAFNPGVPFLVYAPILLVAGLLLAFVAKETLVKERAPAGA